MKTSDFGRKAERRGAPTEVRYRDSRGAPRTRRMQTTRPTKAELIEALESRIAPAAIFTWKNDANGNWNDPSNWTLTSGTTLLGYPNALGDEARFSVGTTSHVVTIPNAVDITVSKIQFNDDVAWTIAAAGSGSLTLDGAATIVQTGPAGSAAITAPIRLFTDATIQNFTTAALTLSGAITEQGGSWGLTIDSNNLVRLTGAAANTFTGLTRIDDGTLFLGKSGGASALNSQLVLIGTGTGAAGDAKLVLGANDQIGDSSLISLVNDGELDTAGFSDTIGTLGVASGDTAGSSVKTGAGTLRTSGISMSSFGTGAVGASIVGSIELTGTSAQIGVANGSAATDLLLNGKLTAANGFTKIGAGQLELAGGQGNSVSGATKILNGTLLLNTNGVGVANDRALSNDITIGPGSTLRLVNSFELSDVAVIKLVDNARLEVASGYEDVSGVIFSGTGGGVVSVAAGATFELQPGGQVTVEQAAVKGGQITGAGTLNLDGFVGATNRVNFNIADTAADVDLLVNVAMTSTPSTAPGIEKTGFGLARFATNSSVTAPVLLTSGTLDFAATFNNAPVTLNGGTLVGAGSVKQIISGANGGKVVPGAFLDSGNVTLGSDDTVAFDLGGFSPGLSVTGTVDLGSAKLDLSTLLLQDSTAPITIIFNDGSDAITGTFAGLNEGDTVVNATGNYTISYVGGTGNDVTLTPIFLAPTISANGKTATFLDRDGDLVTVKTSKGTLKASQFLIHAVGEDGGQLARLTLNDPQDGFAGAKISISAKRVDGFSDGKVNVGYINASGIDLGSLTVAGDLGRVLVGDATKPGKALASLVVDSIGVQGLTTQAGAQTSNESIIDGDIGTVLVKGDLSSADVTFGYANSTTGSIRIGGSLRGDSNEGIIHTGKIGSLTIVGDVLGSNITGSGGVIVENDAKSISIGGSLRAGDAISAQLRVNNVGSLTIGGDVVGGDSPFSGLVTFQTAKTVKIGGNLEGGAGEQSGFIRSQSGIGSLTIGRDVLGGSGQQSGSVIISGTGSIGTTKIGGSVVAGENGGTGLFADRFGSITIGRDLRGEAGHRAIIAAAGTASPDARSAVAIAALTVGGSVGYADVLAGYESDSTTPTFADQQIGKIAVKGSWNASRALASVASNNGIFGDGDDTAVTTNDTSLVSRIASITIGGGVQGTAASGDRFGFVAQQIGMAKIGSGKIPLSATTTETVALGTFGDVVLAEI